MVSELWKSSNGVIIGPSAIPTKTIEQLSSKAKSSWTAGNKIWRQGIPTRPQAHSGGDSSPTAGVMLVSVWEENREPQGPGRTWGGEPGARGPTAERGARRRAVADASGRGHRKASPASPRPGRGRCGWRPGWRGPERGRRRRQKWRSGPGESDAAPCVPVAEPGPRSGSVRAQERRVAKASATQKHGGRIRRRLHERRESAGRSVISGGARRRALPETRVQRADENIAPFPSELKTF